jgi:PKD repeat protein
VLKVGAEGSMKWDQSYGGGEYDRVHDAVATSDGGFVLAGQTASQGEGEKDGWMLKINGDGETEWERTFGTERMDAFFGIHDDPDGGYVVSGTKHVLGEEGADGWVVKTDGAGHEQWGKTYGGEYWDKFWPVIEGHGSGYLAIGESTSYDDNRDGFVVRLGGPAVAAIQDGTQTETGTRVPLTDSPVRAVTLSDSNVSGVLAVAEQANTSAFTPPGDPLYAVTMDGPELAANASATVEFEVQTEAVTDELSDLRVVSQTDTGWEILNTTVVSQANGTAVLSAETDTAATLVVTSVPAPTASIDAKQVVTVDESVELSAASSSAEEGTLTAYRWTVGDESLAGQTASVTFDEAGERTVELTVTDQNGLRDTANATLVVNDKPEVSVSTPDSATVGKAASLSADVSDEVGDVTVTWQFGGATVTGKSVEHSFGSPGTKTVTVVVEDEYGAKITKEVEVEVQASGDSDAGQATTTGTNEETGNGGGVPGFGVGVALMALVVAALLGRFSGE